MKTLAFFILASALLLGCTSPTIDTASEGSNNYSKRILGRWLGPRKFAIFHANGTWGVQRNEDTPEDIDGRSWRIKGKQLFLTFRGDHGLQTTEFTIISFTPQKFITEVDGYKRTYDRSP